MMAAGWRFERHKLVFLFPFFFQIKVHTHASERTSVACVEMCVCGTYKAVSARLAGLAVGDHHRLVDVAKSLEVLAERRVVGVVRQPAHEDLGEGGVLLKRRRRRRVHDFQGSSVHELVQEHLARPGRKGRGRSGGEKEEAGDPLRDAWTRLRSPPVSGGGQKKKRTLLSSDNRNRPGDKSAQGFLRCCCSLAFSHRLLFATNRCQPPSRHYLYATGRVTPPRCARPIRAPLALQSFRLRSAALHLLLSFSATQRTVLHSNKREHMASW